MMETVTVAAKQVRNQHEWVESMNYLPGNGELIECRAQYRQLYKTINGLILALESQSRLSRKPKLMHETKDN